MSDRRRMNHLTQDRDARPRAVLQHWPCPTGCGTVLEFRTDRLGRLLERCPKCDPAWRRIIPDATTEPPTAPGAPRLGSRGRFRQRVLAAMPETRGTRLPAREIAVRLSMGDNAGRARVSDAISVLIRTDRIERARPRVREHHHQQWAYWAPRVRAA